MYQGTILSFLENTLKWFCIFVVFSNITSTTFLSRAEWQEPRSVSAEELEEVCVFYLDCYQTARISWGLPVLWAGTQYPGAAVPRPSAAGGWMVADCRLNRIPDSPGLRDSCLVPLEMCYSFSLYQRNLFSLSHPSAFLRKKFSWICCLSAMRSLKLHCCWSVFYSSVMLQGVPCTCRALTAPKCQVWTDTEMLAFHLAAGAIAFGESKCPAEIRRRSAVGFNCRWGCCPLVTWQ